MTTPTATTAASAASIAAAAGHTDTGSASAGIAKRSLRNIRRIPSAFLPALLMPVFQVISFTGTYRGVTDIPTFPTDRSANWFLPLALVMGCSFAGMGLGFATILTLVVTPSALMIKVNVHDWLARRRKTETADA